MTKPISDCRLYAFVDTAYLHGRAPETVARQLCDGGADLIQVRAKKSSPDEIRRMAEKILPVTRSSGVGLVINDHLAVAREIGADYCHLGQQDFFDAGHTQVSQLSTPESAGSPARAGGARPAGTPDIGLSTHAPDQALRAIDAAPAYIAVGPVYATGTKPGAKPVTLTYVRWAAENVKLPWFAIGGITLENLENVLAAGAGRICVVSAILNSSDVTAACTEFRRRLVTR